MHVYDVFSNYKLLIYFSGVLPDRPNIFLQVEDRGKRYKPQLGWLVELVREKGAACPKTLIYCSSINKVAKLHEWFVGSLGDKAWTQDSTGGRIFANRLVCQFHKSVGPELEEVILDTFPRLNTTLRVLICTVAFGMGINIPDIKYVLHWGMSQSVPHYWQEVGRCARHITNCKAIIYPVRLEQNNPLAQIVQCYLAKRQCVRKLILQEFVMNGIELDAMNNEHEPCMLSCDICMCDRCKCCTYCMSLCPCYIK